MSFITLSIWCAVAYVCGAIPFGYVLVKFFLKQDVRQQGSGNIGATNVLRTGSRKLAAATLILDALKIWIPLMAFDLIANPMNDLPADTLLSAQMIIGAIGVIGHMYSCWLKFNGGKGIASLTGYVLWLFPYGGVIGFIAFFIVLFSTKVVSIGSLVGVAAAAGYVIICIFPTLDTPDSLVMFSKVAFVFMSLLIFWRHKSNILRLIRNEEKRIKF